MLTRIALPFVAIDALGAGAWEMSALGIARLVPGLAFGIAIAAWIEQRRKRGVMICVDLAHAVLLSAVPLAATLGSPSARPRRNPCASAASRARSQACG
jgi:hypothetical protein